MVLSTFLPIVAGRFGLAPTAKKRTTAGIKMYEDKSVALASNDPAGAKEEGGGARYTALLERRGSGLEGSERTLKQFAGRAAQQHTGRRAGRSHPYLVGRWRQLDAFQGSSYRL